MVHVVSLITDCTSEVVNHRESILKIVSVLARIDEKI